METLEPGSQRQPSYQKWFQWLITKNTDWHICLYGLIHPGSYKHIKDKGWVLLSVHGPEHMQLMFKAHRLAARMVLPRFTLLSSPQACIQLSLASAQLLHGWGPQHHTLGNAFSTPWCCSPRAAGAKAGMKGLIVYHAYKGSVLRFSWGRAMLKGSCQHKRTEWNYVVSSPLEWGFICSEQLKQLANHAVSAFPKKALCPEPVERQPLKVILAKPSSAIAGGLPVVKGRLSVLAWLSLGWSLFAAEAPEDWGAGKQESGVYSLAFSPQMWNVWQHWIFITRESMCSYKGSLTSSNNLWLNKPF